MVLPEAVMPRAICYFCFCFSFSANGGKCIRLLSDSVGNHISKSSCQRQAGPLLPA